MSQLGTGVFPGDWTRVECTHRTTNSHQQNPIHQQCGARRKWKSRICCTSRSRSRHKSQSLTAIKNETLSIRSQGWREHNSRFAPFFSQSSLRPPRRISMMRTVTFGCKCDCVTERIFRVKSKTIDSVRGMPRIRHCDGLGRDKVEINIHLHHIFYEVSRPPRRSRAV